MQINSTSDAIEMHSQDVLGFDAQYQTSLDFRQRYEVWTALIQRHSRTSGKVIDVGCGSGVFSFFTAQYNAAVLGVDGSAEMVALCQKKLAAKPAKQLSFIQSRIEGLSQLRLERAELVLCSSVLEYVDDLELGFAILTQLMAPEGTLIVSMPNRHSWYRRLERMAFKWVKRPSYLACVQHFSSLQEMNKLAAQNGLQNVESCHYGNFFPRASGLLGLAKSPAMTNLVAAVYRRKR